MTTYLSVQSIYKRFSTTLAVDNLSFDVQAGQIFALLGPNGAGKTTVVRMLLGLIHPDRGTIRFPQSPGGAIPFSRAIGYLPEERGLYIDQTIIDSLVYFARLRGVAKSTALACASEWLEHFDLLERCKEKLGSLSKGNQQKIQFIAAIQHTPQVVFLDEPFSGLDPINQEKILGLLAELKDQGMTIILCAHQMPLVERLADDLLLMSDGKSVLQGSLSQILTDHAGGTRLTLGLGSTSDIRELVEHQGVLESTQNGDSVSLLLDSSVDLNELLRWLASNWDLNSIHTERASLHDVYVEAVSAADGGELG